MLTLHNVQITDFYFATILSYFININTMINIRLLILLHTIIDRVTGPFNDSTVKSPVVRALVDSVDSLTGWLGGVGGTTRC